MFIRLNPDGSFDNHFDSDGIKWMGQAASDDVINGLVLQPDGKIVGAGFTQPYATYSPDMMAIRLTENGSPDRVL